jgi:histidinol dehydrogenase/sulfopropanediol 3-dehydrogenase
LVIIFNSLRGLLAPARCGAEARTSIEPAGTNRMSKLAPALEARITHIKAPGRSAWSDNSPVEATVKTVLDAVRREGDEAVRRYSREFDKLDIEAFEVTATERAAALDGLESQTRADTEFAIERVRAFAEAQRQTLLPLEIEALPGLHLGHRIIPIARIGAYVPGGRYPLLSAPIMTIVPAKVAGCDEVIACLPPGAHPAMIAGCHLSGAHRIFRIGGAQAIAAMAFGTESVPAVDKIVGPGNAYVNEAKRQVFGLVGIDQLAGPSEIFVVADETGDAVTIAVDLLAQAEHDVRTRVGLITTDRGLAEKVLTEVERQLGNLSTAPVAAAAWRDYGEIVVCADEAAMLDYSDHIAAEHLEVHTRDAKATAAKLRNYGSIFIGVAASVVYSDKCCGTNHTLPTMAAGRYTGGLWVGSYLKTCTHQWLDERGVAAVAPPAMRQSASEGLEGHRRAAALRLAPAQLLSEIGA